MYPEHQKMSEVVERSQTIGEFLAWLDQRGIRLCRLTDNTRRMDYSPVCDSTEVLLAEYFGIDLKVIEAEKRAMADACRRAVSTVVTIP